MISERISGEIGDSLIRGMEVQANLDPRITPNIVGSRLGLCVIQGFEMSALVEALSVQSVLTFDPPVVL